MEGKKNSEIENKKGEIFELNDKKDIKKGENDKDENKENILEEKEIEDLDESNSDKKESYEQLENQYIIERNLTGVDGYDRSIKVIFLGDSNVGKSTLVHKLIKGKFVDSLLATLSIEYHNYTIKINDYVLRMQIWDTAGQEKFNSIISNYYKSTDVSIFLYAVDNEATFENIKEWYNQVKENNLNEEMINVLIGNKNDVDKKEKMVPSEKAQNFANEHNFLLFKEISCKDESEEEMKNINDIFDEIGKKYYDIYRNYRHMTGDSDSFNYIASKSMVELGNKQRKDKDKNLVKVKEKRSCC